MDESSAAVLPDVAGESADEWRQTPRIVRRLLVGFIALYIVVFFALAAMKTYYCTHSADDTAIFNNLFWSTLHGRLFYNYSVGRDHLADHASFILFALIPLYAAIPGVATLLLIQTLCIGAGGIPFFLIARRWVRSWPALILTMAFLLHPGVVSQNVNQVHARHFALPLLLFAFYFMERKDFRRFLICFVLASLVEETLLPPMLFFGVYAAVRGLRGKWAWFPPVYAILFGGTYLLVVSLAVGGWRGASYFAGYGSTPLEILRTFFSHPASVIGEATQPHKLLYLNQLFQPVGWVIAFFSPAVLLAASDILVNMLGTAPVLSVIWCHYSLMAGAFLCVAAADGVGRIGRRLSPGAGAQRTQGVLAGVILGLTLLTALPAPAGAWFYPWQYRPTERQGIIQEIIRRVPAQASVLAPRQLIAAFSERSRIATLDIKNPTFERLWGFDYAIFDEADRRNALLSPNREMMEAYAKSPDYRVVYRSAGFIVYERVKKPETTRPESDKSRE